MSIFRRTLVRLVDKPMDFEGQFLRDQEAKLIDKLKRTLFGMKSKEETDLNLVFELKLRQIFAKNHVKTDTPFFNDIINEFKMK